MDTGTIRDKLIRMALIRTTTKRLFTPGETLSQRAVRGGIWVFALRITTRLFSLARMIVLARLLAPEDFGLFGIALLSLSTLQTFSVTGVDKALIQKKGDVRNYLDTAWSIQVLRGLILGCILFAISPLVADFFNEPNATMLIRVVALAVVIRDFKNIGVVFFQKKIEFHKDFIFQVSGVVADLVVSALAAIMLRNAWALVFGLLAGHFARLVLSYMLHPYRPSFKLDWEESKELLSFGRWFFLSAVFFYVVTQGDNAVVGKMLGAVALGLYQLALRISDVATTEIMHVFSQLMFPVYSDLQDNIPKLRRWFLSTLNLVAFIVVPTSAGVYLLGGDFVTLFLGQRWTPMIPVLKILVIAGLVRALTGTGGVLYWAVGQPNINSLFQFMRAVVMGICIFPLTTAYGVEGTGVAVLFGLLGTIPVWWVNSIRIARVPWHWLPREIIQPFVGAAVMSFGITLIRQWNSELSIWTFSLRVLLGIVIYISYHSAFWLMFRKGTIENLYELRMSAVNGRGM